MTAAQIDILLKDKDIWYFNTDYACDNMNELSIKIDCVEYALSNKIVDIFNKFFYSELSFERDLEHGFFKKNIQNKILLISSLKDQKLIFYHNELQYQNDQLDSIVNGNYYNTIPDLISFTFSVLLEQHGLAWVECLKFKVLKGTDIANFSFHKNPNIKYLKDFFKTTSLNSLYRLATIEQNIKYLQTLIADIGKPKKDEPTHRDKAIAYIFKGYEYPDKYPTLRRVDANLKKNGGKNFEIALGLLGYFGKKTKPFELEDLIRVKEFGLLDNPDEPKALQYLNRRIKELSYPQS